MTVYFSEKGPWTVSPDGRCLLSGDFAHDAKLIIDGDFTDNEQRMAYAIELCRRLNAANPSPVETA